MTQFILNGNKGYGFLIANQSTLLSIKSFFTLTFFLLFSFSSIASNSNSSEEELLLATTGNADAVVSGVGSGNNVFLGIPDNNATHIWTNASTILDLTDVIPAGESINITLGHIWNTDGIAEISSSASTSGFSDLEIYGSSSNGSVTIPSNNSIGLETITYTATVDVRYIKIAVTNQNVQLDAISYSFVEGCGISILSTTSENCAGTGPYTADWKVIIEYSNQPTGDITYERNSEAPVTFTPNLSPDTISIVGIPADGGSDEIKVYFSNENSCRDSVIVTRPAPCPFGLDVRGPGELCDGMLEL